jgi:hypothetical protein
MSKVARDLGQRNEKQIAKIVPAQAVASAEAMREKLYQQIFFLAKRNHAIAQVAWGEHIEVFAQTAGGAAVIGYCDHCGKVCNLRRLGARLAWHTYMASKPAQQSRKSGAAADCHHSQRARRIFMGGRASQRWGRRWFRERLRGWVRVFYSGFGQRHKNHRFLTEFQDTATL